MDGISQRRFGQFERQDRPLNSSIHLLCTSTQIRWCFVAFGGPVVKTAEWCKQLTSGHWLSHRATPQTQGGLWDTRQAGGTPHCSRSQTHHVYARTAAYTKTLHTLTRTHIHWQRINQVGRKVCFSAGLDRKACMRECLLCVEPLDGCVWVSITGLDTVTSKY